MKKITPGASLTDVADITVRFSEVDSMRIVWHGNYVHYFEDGRESFGRHYPGLGYPDIAASGYTAPIVKLEVDFKQSLRYGDEAVVETRYIDSDAAKICFEYEIRRKSDGMVAVTGRTVQVFLNPENQLELANPGFYLEWKRKWLR